MRIVLIRIVLKKQFQIRMKKMKVKLKCVYGPMAGEVKTFETDTTWNIEEKAANLFGVCCRDKIGISKTYDLKSLIQVKAIVGDLPQPFIIVIETIANAHRTEIL